MPTKARVNSLTKDPGKASIGLEPRNRNSLQARIEEFDPPTRSGEAGTAVRRSQPMQSQTKIRARVRLPR